ncbi:unnamed protein product [Chrysodeixis includens]|uniref:Peroxidase n=1 Tax=Chrysodeixis includens TaxID=689277 RepID=A0A9N8KU19_CHRIL|nr:unnamed protein product [Chrysodeixis includens]
MMLKSIVGLLCCVQVIYAVRYHRFSGERVTPSELEAYRANNTLAKCTIDVQPCKKSERRRLDGSCNSLKNPSRGTVTVPHHRVLPAAYDNGNQERKSVSGKPLKLPREIRTALLCEGISNNDFLTSAVPGFGIFSFGDVGTVHDIKFFMDNKTDCCTEKGQKDFLCAPNIIPEDDPVHRFSGIRCMNLTRPLDFQYFGCTKDPVPAPIEEATSVYDLSPIYIIEDNVGVPVRTNKGGELVVEVDNGIVWPPSGKGYCPATPAKAGQKCFENYSNALLPVQMFAVWFVRHHNYLAQNLAKVNPQWSDDQIYFTARDINIAYVQEMLVYQFMATLLGKDDLVKSGLASKSKGFRETYDPQAYPQITLEFVIVYRWFHLIQNGVAKMLDGEGNYVKEHRVVNSTFNAGFLGEDDNIVYLTQGLFRQEAARANTGVHPDLAELGLPNLQLATDIITSDLHKNRLFGLRPYVDYVKFCFDEDIESFEDLEKRIPVEKVSILRDLYEDPKDIDLMAGLWTEKINKNAHIPPTLGCLLKDSIHRTIKGDRHWYERSDRPHAFTHAQLQEVRKASLANLLCAVGDKVEKVQKNAFLQISKKNPLVSCDKIPKINFKKWAQKCT